MFFIRFFFITKGGYTFRSYNCHRDTIPDFCRSYMSSTLVNIELVLGTIRHLEPDDLRVLDISGTCTRLPVHVVGISRRRK